MDTLYTERIGIQEPTVYLDRHGDLYQTPGTRAELLNHLHIQRRLVAHLVDVIAYVSRCQTAS